MSLGFGKTTASSIFYGRCVKFKRCSKFQRPRRFYFRFSDCPLRLFLIRSSKNFFMP
ncbi:hypothetical protein YC2023_119656 [Brassica napus]